jgi:hypothetical protein
MGYPPGVGLYEAYPHCGFAKLLTHVIFKSSMSQRLMQEARLCLNTQSPLSSLGRGWSYGDGLVECQVIGQSVGSSERLRRLRDILLAIVEERSKELYEEANHT